MTIKELLNLIDWLRGQGFSNEKITECLETVIGSKNITGTTADDMANESHADQSLPWKDVGGFIDWAINQQTQRDGKG